MAIAFSASHGGAVGGGVTTLNLNTLTIGADTLILCGIRYNSNTVTVSSLNLDDGGGGSAQAFTQLGTYSALDTSNARVSLWYLLAPNTANTRIIVNNSASTDTYMVAAAWSGTAQSSPFTTATQTENTTNPTTTDTSDRNGSWQVAVASSGNAGITPDVNTTQRVEQSDNTQLADSNSEINSGSNYTLGWTDGGSSGVVSAMMRPPAVAGAGGSAQAGFMNLMGVGN